MRFILISCLAFLLAPAHLFGQKDPMKFGKVPAEDLAMRIYESDTSAAAVVLGDFGEVKFHFKENDVGYLFHRHRRIKILKRSGFDQGDIVIPFYSKKRLEDVKNIKALVISPDGQVTDVSKREIFEEQVNDYWSRVRFTIPNLAEGCVIEYQYNIVSTAIFQLPEWYFQEEIPIRWSELRVEIPEWYDYTFIRQGRPLDVAEQNVTTENFYVSGGFSSSGNISAKVSKNRYVMKDVPALKEESFITTMDDYYARIRFQLSSIRYPNAPLKQIMSTWPDVAKELWEDEKFGGQLKRKRNYDNAWSAALPAVQNAGTPEEKCQALYDFVLSNVNLEEGRGVFVRNSLNDCFAKKKAKSHEINLLLVALLREAGIEAHPVLVSNRDHGRALPLYPLMDQFDNVLALAVMGETRLLLDATDPHRPMGYPDMNALNSAGWAAIEGNPQWIDIVPPSGSDTYLLTFALSEEGSLDGSITMSSSGYSAVSEREQIKESPSGEFFKKRISERFPDARVDSMNFDGSDIHAKAFKAVAACQLPAMAQVSGDFIYLAPAVMSSFTKNPFKLEQRTYPVDMPYPFQERIVLNLALPEGYVVEELPEPVRMAMPDNAGSFHFQMSQRDNSLQLISTLQVNRLRYEPEQYLALRNFFGLVEEKMGEQVVLKRG
jgi:hypothetical protein